VRLILARHGDTFNPGDRVVFVGARNDLPLTENGRAQACALGELLSRSHLGKLGVLCGPLQRTKVYAEIATQALSPAPKITVDTRLNELDYGKWAGLTNDEVRATFGEGELSAWNNQSLWPKNAGWPESETELAAEALSLISDLKKSGLNTALLVSSNGRLRYFLKSIPWAFEHYASGENIKVNTGNICVLEFSATDEKVLNWNVPPTSISSI